MKRQMSFAEAESAGKKRVTKRQRFLAEMEKVVPWQRLLSAIGPHYPRGERGRPPIGLERMLRIYFLQQWYGLSDEGLEDALHDSMAMRAFAGIDLAVEDVPDATTLLKFRRLLNEPPEANMGGGPIDFKFSSGYDARVLVEMKRSNGSVRHGYEKQLEYYKEAAKTFHGIFVIIDYGDLGPKLNTIQAIRASRIEAGENASDIVVIDATRKPSASKRP
ncbi:hypothetical protein GRD98_05785 [Ralstonia solanacearum]|nr:hypothetical protein GRD98_05785 [Ralstonia solanacearum]